METTDKPKEATNESTTTCVKKTNGQKVLKLKLTRDGKEGIKLFLQSNQDWDFLKNTGGKMINIAGVKCAWPRQDTLNGVPGRFYADNVWEVEGLPNLGVLLAENLKEGVTLNFGVFPISENKIQQYLSQLKESVKIIYLTYCKPLNIEVEINTSTVEREEHY